MSMPRATDILTVTQVIVYRDLFGGWLSYSSSAPEYIVNLTLVN